MEFRKVQMEYQIKLMALDSVKNAFETQRLMSSPEWRREKEQEVAVMERNLQVFQAENVAPRDTAVLDIPHHRDTNTV